MAAESAATSRSRPTNNRSWIIYVPDDSGAAPELTSYLRLGARYDAEAPGALPLSSDSEIEAENQEPYGVRLRSAGEYSESVSGRRFAVTADQESGDLVEASYTRQTPSGANRRSTVGFANQESFTQGQRLEHHDGLRCAPQTGLEIATKVGGQLEITEALAKVSIANATMKLDAGEGGFSTELPRLGRSLVERNTSELRASRRIALTAAPAAVSESLAESRVLAVTSRVAMLAINAVFAGIAASLAGKRSEEAVKDGMERGQALVAMSLSIYGLLQMVGTALGVLKMTRMRENAEQRPDAGIQLTPDGIMLYTRTSSGVSYVNLSGGMITLAAPVNISSHAPNHQTHSATDNGLGEHLVRLYRRSGD